MRSHQRHPVILTRTNKFSYITKTNSVTGQKQIQLGLNLWKRKTLTRTLRGKAILPRSLQKKPLVTRYYLTADTPKRDSMDYPSNSIRNAALFSTLSCPLQKQNRNKKPENDIFTRAIATLANHALFTVYGAFNTVTVSSFIPALSSFNCGF